MLGLPAAVKALLFDLDGVLTTPPGSTPPRGSRCSTPTCASGPSETMSRFVPFEIATDYQLYVDGKPRYDGVRSFLASRGITLPEGDTSDPPARRQSPAWATARTTWSCG